MEEVSETIEFARLNKDELKPFVQLIYLDDISQNDISLMQVSSDVVGKLKEGERLIMRGESSEPAVICSKSSTFEVKAAETSNSLLLLRGLQFPEKSKISGSICENSILKQEVINIANSYYELKPCKPKLLKLTQLLKKCVYAGKEYEEDGGEKYTLHDLLSCVQASEEELLLELQKIHACEIDGYIRLLDFKYKFEILSQICDTIDSESISWRKIPKNHILALLEDLHPRHILESCFSWYAEKIAQTNENEEQLYSLKEYDVCRIYAEVLLKPTSMFNLGEFLSGWSISVPEEMHTDLSQLEGLAIVDYETKPEVICYFPLDELPEKIPERFSALFQKRSKWTFEDIKPYISNLAIGKTDVKMLLAKHTRSSISNDQKFYSSKW